MLIKGTAHEKTHVPVHSMCSVSISYHWFWPPHQHFYRKKDFFSPIQDFTML